MVVKDLVGEKYIIYAHSNRIERDYLVIPPLLDTHSANHSRTE